VVTLKLGVLHCFDMNIEMPREQLPHSFRGKKQGHVDQGVWPFGVFNTVTTFKLYPRTTRAYMGQNLAGDSIGRTWCRCIRSAAQPTNFLNYQAESAETRMRRLLRVVVGKMMLIPGSSDATTLFFTSCKCIRLRVADVVAITGLGLLPLFAWALGIHDLPRAWPGLDAAFYRTRQFLSDYKAEASRFVKRPLLRLACPKFTLKYFLLENEDIRSRLFDAGDWRRGSYLHSSCLTIMILNIL
jgi:hypothetical protein